MILLIRPLTLEPRPGDGAFLLRSLAALLPPFIQGVLMTQRLSDSETRPTAETDDLSSERQRLIDDLAHLVLHVHRHRLRQCTDPTVDVPAHSATNPSEVTTDLPCDAVPEST